MSYATRFTAAGRQVSEFWTPERDHLLLEAHGQAGRGYNPLTGREQGADWRSVSLIFSAMTGHLVPRHRLASRWNAVIRDMEVELAVARAVIRMADEEAARVLTPLPVPVDRSWPGLSLPVRASIAPSQERMPT